VKAPLVVPAAGCDVNTMVAVDRLPEASVVRSVPFDKTHYFGFFLPNN
jgi:hypothetical protein